MGGPVGSIRYMERNQWWESYHLQCLHQIAGETRVTIVGKARSKVISMGWMTYSFLKAIEGGSAHTYGDILTSMRSTIRERKHPMLLTNRNLSHERPQDWLQEPQLTSSEQFDVYKERFSL